LLSGNRDRFTVLLVLQADFDRRAVRGLELRLELYGRPRLGAGHDKGGVNLAGVGLGGENVFVFFGILTAEKPFELALAQYYRRGRNDAALVSVDLEGEVFADRFSLDLRCGFGRFFRGFRRSFRRSFGLTGEGGESGEAA
jgi:hypothetical protein